MITLRQPELEAYLRRATRGLSGSRKLEVQSELEEHVLELAWAMSELFFRHMPRQFVNSVQALQPGDDNVMLIRFNGRITVNGPAFETIRPN